MTPNKLSPAAERRDEARLWWNFCRRTARGGADGYWIRTALGEMLIIEDKDACKKAAEYDQAARDKLMRYAIWRLKS